MQFLFQFPTVLYYSEVHVLPIMLSSSAHCGPSHWLVYAAVSKGKPALWRGTKARIHLETPLCSGFLCCAHFRGHMLPRPGPHTVGRKRLSGGKEKEGKNRGECEGEERITSVMTALCQDRNSSLCVWLFFFKADDDGSHISSGSSGQTFAFWWNPGSTCSYKGMWTIWLRTDTLKRTIWLVLLLVLTLDLCWVVVDHMTSVALVLYNWLSTNCLLIYLRDISFL